MDPPPFIDSLRGAILIDQSGKIISCDSAVEEILDLPQSMIEEANFDDVMSTVTSNSWRELKGKKEQYNGWLKVHNKNFYVEMIKFHSEHINSITLCILYDSSNQKNSDNEMEVYQSMIEEMVTAIESSYDGFFLTDGDGNILRVNKSWEKITGVSARDVIGRNVFDLEKKGYFSRSVSRLALVQKKSFTLQKKWFTGKEVLVTASPILDKDDNIKMIICNVRDLGDIRRLSAQLKKSDMDYKYYQNKVNNLKKRVFEDHHIVAESKEMINILELSDRVKSIEAPILITGETGVGKEVVASYIHRNSSRSASGPFITINCGAIPENLLESELFGYEPGAFTGASEKGKDGIFESAEGGTLLLDEIGDLPLHLQVKLLRVLQESQIMKIGGRTPIKIDVRIISATNRDLEKMIIDNSFRQDLYFRLNVIPIHIPPLRSRRDDILHLTELFFYKANIKYKKDVSLSRDALDYLLCYKWPGNVRELVNIIERLVIITPNSSVTPECLPNYIREAGMTTPSCGSGNFKEKMREFEVNLINHSIEKYGSVGRAAKYLEIDTTTIYRKLKGAKTHRTDAKSH